MAGLQADRSPDSVEATAEAVRSALARRRELRLCLLQRDGRQRLKRLGVPARCLCPLASHPPVTPPSSPTAVIPRRPVPARAPASSWSAAQLPAPLLPCDHK